MTAPPPGSVRPGPAPAVAARPLRVAVTGASGFLGRSLVRALAARGHVAVPISRSPAAGGVRWDPERGLLDPAALEGVDAAVHLAGENLGERWTRARRRRILDSRVLGTTLLARALATLERRPSALVSMSAVGYYGDAGDRELDESAPHGAGFLADVAGAWEAAADPARAAGLRVVHPRLGVVLHPDGGALARMLPVFRLGLGGRLGSGRQWMSWISRDDAVRALLFLLESPQLHGPVNVVAPQPVRNRDFTAALGRALGRPTPWVVPALALRVAFGEMGVATLLGGQRVRCDRLLGAGFTFRHPTIAEALRGVRSEE